jgi:hypothetical protein
MEQFFQYQIRDAKSYAKASAFTHSGSKYTPCELFSPCIHTDCLNGLQTYGFDIDTRLKVIFIGYKNNLSTENGYMDIDSDYFNQYPFKSINRNSFKMGDIIGNPLIKFTYNNCIDFMVKTGSSIFEFDVYHSFDVSKVFNSIYNNRTKVTLDVMKELCYRMTDFVVLSNILEDKITGAYNILDNMED